jgi:membrane protein
MAPSTVDLDRYQRRHPVVGFPLAVVYKFVDDQCAYLAAGLTYYAFVAIFPLLLIASSILGFVLQGDRALEQQVLSSALSQFPIVGEQLGRPRGLHGSTSAVVIGTLAALYGALGVGQAGQNAMFVVWAVPRNTRPDPFLGRLRGLVLLAAAGLGLMLVTVVSSVAINVSFFGADLGGVLDWLLRLVSVLVTALVLAVLFRLSTASTLGVRAALPGALVVSVLWHTLQWFGGFYVRHVIARASSMNAIFALVLGLLVLIYLAALATLLGAQVNVVRKRSLYPRALLAPFTDNVELTPADRRAYRYYAKAQRHKGFERVDVRFDADPPDGDEDQGRRAPAGDI